MHYRCTVCEYVYDDSQEGMAFNELPDDWPCPACNASKDFFEAVVTA